MDTRVETRENFPPQTKLSLLDRLFFWYIFNDWLEGHEKYTGLNPSWVLNVDLAKLVGDQL